MLKLGVGVWGWGKGVKKGEEMGEVMIEKRGRGGLGEVGV